MDNLVAVFWDDAMLRDREVERSSLETYFTYVITKNKALQSYIGKNLIYRFIEHPESYIDNNISSETKTFFVLAELKQNKQPRSSLRGLSLVKQLRKKRIKAPIILYSFFDKDKDFDFCDKDDFINPGCMQFFVRLPGLNLWPDNDEQKPLRVLADDELDELLNNQYDKKQKASLLLDKLLEDLKRIADDDKHKTMELIKNIFQSMIKWVPQKAGHAIYLTVLPNKLKRLQTQMQRIDLLEKYKDRLLEGIDIDHDGLAG